MSQNVLFKCLMRYTTKDKGEAGYICNILSKFWTGHNMMSLHLGNWLEYSDLLHVNTTYNTTPWYSQCLFFISVWTFEVPRVKFALSSKFLNIQRMQILSDTDKNMTYFIKNLLETVNWNAIICQCLKLILFCLFSYVWQYCWCLYPVWLLWGPFY